MQLDNTLASIVLSVLLSLKFYARYVHEPAPQVEVQSPIKVELLR